MPSETKQCLTCHKALYGRVDKKFCDDYCRTAFNNQFKSDNKAVKVINAVLRKNRKVLELLIQEKADSVIVSSGKLAENGFNFTYHTHTIIKKGVCYYYCYEYGYLPLENAMYQLIRKSEH